MTENIVQNDRSRLGLAIIAATLLHVLIGVGTLFVDWTANVPPQEFGPVLVDFEPIMPPQIAAVSPTPQPVQPPPPAPVQPTPQPSVQPPPPTPQPPAPTPQPPTASAQPAPAPRPAQPAPQPTPPPRTATPTQPADPVPRHDIPMQEWDAASLQGATRSEAPRIATPSPPRDVDEAATAAAGELPAWAGQVMAESGISTAAMDQAQVVSVARRVDSDPRFRSQLQAAIAAVQSAPASRPGTAGSTGGSAPGSTTSTPGTEAGDGMIRWASDARGGVPAVPRITSDMFGGTVPARIEFVVLFDVDSSGRVVPGSLVFQTRSGYTRVNEEVRRTVSGWTFQQKPGAPVESAIFTLIVFREDVH